MESQPQNPEFRINPENFHTCTTLPLSLHLIVDLVLYVPSTIFQLNRDGSSWVEPVLS